MCLGVCAASRDGWVAARGSDCGSHLCVTAFAPHLETDGLRRAVKFGAATCVTRRLRRILRRMGCGGRVISGKALWCHRRFTEAFYEAGAGAGRNSVPTLSAKGRGPETRDGGVQRAAK